MSMLSLTVAIVILMLILDSLVLSALTDALQKDPKRKCFRMVGGVLVERTVEDVVPALRTNRDGVSDACFMPFHPLKFTQIKSVVSNLVSQYKAKDNEFEVLKREYNVRSVARA